ncbi:hypothetical protein GALMADRAFT_257534 [Galerina marginata CBS 339.88]|uniref:Uncharacterized protein n=1 Tax=Galerina marginata (strain CBS 339.88) TaxID=685588 RepID=A0A067SAR0_GALM3|nr:hypothetical protein GALMADRAFT_257534 [Galerina marginata CBS 339.88]
MVALSQRPTTPAFNNPKLKNFAIVAGGATLVLFAVLGIKKDIEKKETNLARNDYKSTDALSVSHRPAKNANTKGSTPTASKWV